MVGGVDLVKLQDSLELEKNFRHVPYLEKVKKAYDEIIRTSAKDVIKRGRQERDDYLGGIYGGKIYLIGAESGMGKTTFMNQVSDNVSMMGHKVVRYSLEDRLEDIGKQDIFYEVNRLRRVAGKEPYNWHKFNNNEYGDNECYEYMQRAVKQLAKKTITELDKKKKVSIEELCELMEEEAEKGAKLFFIDHLHYFEISTKERRDLMIENIMHQINEIARKHNVAIFLVAHYKKNQSKYQSEPSYSQFKDGSAIYQVANVIIQIERDVDQNISTFYTTKLRGPIQPQIIECEFDLDRFEFNFTKTDKLKIAQRKRQNEDVVEDLF